jgi:hypothetical protein
MHFHGKFYLRLGWRGVRSLRGWGRSLLGIRLCSVSSLDLKRPVFLSFAVAPLEVLLVFRVQGRRMFAGSWSSEPFAWGWAASIALVRCPGEVLVVSTRNRVRSGTGMCGTRPTTPRWAGMGTAVAVAVMRGRTPGVGSSRRSIHRQSCCEMRMDVPSVPAPPSPGILAVVCRLTWVS